MDPIIILSLITVVGIILLLGLFGVCLHFVYRTVNSQTTRTTRGTTGDGATDEPDETIVRGSIDDDSVGAAGDTGDFVFGDSDESLGSGDPKQQL
ncbi:hypothetical protein [Halocatena marina]|uniref:Uncharacterized protein n=1 Tax=Halocatena marina TaxID=2934937 RepID=A0ABD5YQ38_9EURY|nr:hypothetical protein [Halocatena marina]